MSRRHVMAGTLAGLGCGLALWPPDEVRARPDTRLLLLQVQTNQARFKDQP